MPGKKTNKCCWHFRKTEQKVRFVRISLSKKIQSVVIFFSGFLLSVSAAVNYHAIYPPSVYFGSLLISVSSSVIGNWVPSRMCALRPVRLGSENWIFLLLGAAQAVQFLLLIWIQQQRAQEHTPPTVSHWYHTDAAVCPAQYSWEGPQWVVMEVMEVTSCNHFFSPSITTYCGPSPSNGT